MIVPYTPSTGSATSDDISLTTSMQKDMNLLL